MPQGYISVHYVAEDAMRAREVTAFLSGYGFRYRVLDEASTEAERERWLRESELLLAVTSRVAAEVEGSAEIMRQAFIKRLPMICVSLEENELDERYNTGDRPVETVKWPDEEVWDAACKASLLDRLAVRRLCRYPDCFDAAACEKDEYGRLVRHAVQAWQNYPVGQFMLGHAYRQGRLLPLKDVEAAIWLEKAAEQGHLRALVAAGQFRLDGRGVERDEERAFGMFLRAAQGEPKGTGKGIDPVVLALHHVALCYRKGLGVVKDSETAARYFKQAAEAGYAPAQYRLGLAYRDGVGVESDWRAAVKWLHRAARPEGRLVDPWRRRAGVLPLRRISVRQMREERGLPFVKQWEPATGRGVASTGWHWRRRDGYPENGWLDRRSTEIYTIDQPSLPNPDSTYSRWTWDASLAMVALGRLLEAGSRTDRRVVPPNPLAALQYYRMAAACGSSEGCWLMANLYRVGRGLPPDAAQAMRLYRYAAEQSNERAMFALGVCLEGGEATPAFLAEMNEKEKTTRSAMEWAVEWYNRAAGKGYAPAQNNLGGCYERGVGVTRDAIMAVSWYSRAAAQLQPQACCRLARCYEAGEGCDRNNERAIGLYRIAAERGNAYAYYRLGVCYERGVGVPAQKGQAAELYRLAADADVPEGQYAYALCLRAGRGVRRDEQAAYERFRQAAEQGYGPAAVEIGEYLLEGRLILRNREQAVFWLREAVENYDHMRVVPLFDTESVPELGVSWRAAAGRALYRLSCCVRYGEGIVVDDPEEQALELVKRAATLENEDAMTAMGDWHAYTYLQTLSDQEASCAEGWYRRAMKAGQKDASYRLAVLLLKRADRSGDMAWYPEAVELLRDAASEGHVEAMCSLAECYAKGQGVPEDLKTARAWLQRAVEAPVTTVKAQVMLSDFYRMGWGIDPNAEMAMTYTRRAVATEIHAGRYPWMGKRCPRWYAHRIQEEDAVAKTEARFRLAVYGTGEEDDGSKRFFQLCEAVLGGHKEAKEHLACIVAGNSSPEAYFPWLEMTPRPMELALRRGPMKELVPIPAMTTWTVTGEVTEDMRCTAMNHIGDGYYEGRFGLPCKPDTAVRCYREAAALKGQVWAQYSLGWCLLYGVGTPTNKTEAVAFLTQAAISHPQACYELAWCYEKGIGVDNKNVRVALKYYRKALKLGDSRAAIKVKMFEKILKKQQGG